MAAVVTDAVEALAQLAPGPALGAALAGIDPAQVPNNWLPTLLVAQSRQSAHEAARMLGVLAEVVRANRTCDDTAIDQLDRPSLYCADEVRAALVPPAAPPRSRQRRVAKREDQRAGLPGAARAGRRRWRRRWPLRRTRRARW